MGELAGHLPQISNEAEEAVFELQPWEDLGRTSTSSGEGSRCKGPMVGQPHMLREPRVVGTIAKRKQNTAERCWQVCRPC